jgi:tetratricopeptide (TPR) repeat protein
MAWKPRAYGFLIGRADIDIASHADLRRLREITSGEMATAASTEELSFARLELALLERNFAAARDALAMFPNKEFRPFTYTVPREWYAGLIARYTGATEQAAEAWNTAGARMEKMMATRPDDEKSLVVLGEIYARLGRKDDAIRAGEHALELRPMDLDRFSGAQRLRRLADIYAHVGERARALELLATAAKLPNGPDYGDLSLDEMWDPLRSEPSFAEIVRSLAPKN